jgi:hypothetical protein
MSQTIIVVLVIAIALWWFFGRNTSLSTSPSTSPSPAITKSAETGIGKMGRRVYVERDTNEFINLMELSASLVGVKHKAVDGGITPQYPAVFTMESKESREYKELIARHIRKSLETSGKVLVFYRLLPAIHGHGHSRS